MFWPFEAAIGAAAVCGFCDCRRRRRQLRSENAREAKSLLRGRLRLDLTLQVLADLPFLVKLAQVLAVLDFPSPSSCVWQAIQRSRKRLERLGRSHPGGSALRGCDSAPGGTGAVKSDQPVGVVLLNLSGWSDNSLNAA
jgi:hypothetical protein